MGNESWSFSLGETNFGSPRFRMQDFLAKTFGLSFGIRSSVHLAVNGLALIRQTI